MVELKNIKKSFGDQAVLKGVDLKIDTGEVVVILGPSGSGKTTLLRTINYLNPADEGEVVIDDYSLQCKGAKNKDILKLRRKTAMVFQNYNLFKNKTALQNITEGAVTVQHMDRKKANEKAMELLTRMNLADKADYYPSELSGGQQQRIGICRALMLNPHVILLDEPTSALDPELVGEVLEAIKDVAATGITMIVVTHEIAFAKEVATKVVFMEGGVVVEEGTPDELINHPSQERTKQFLRRINGDYKAAV